MTNDLPDDCECYVSCPLHKAAPEMLEALNWALQEMENNDYNGCVSEICLIKMRRAKSAAEGKGGE